MRRTAVVLAVFAMLVSGISLWAAVPAQLTVDPDPAYGLGPGSKVNVCIEVDLQDVPNLERFDVYLNYNTDVVKVENVSNVAFGDFLTSNGAGVATEGVILDEGTPAGTDLYVWAEADWSVVGDLATGSGTLFCIDFVVCATRATLSTSAVMFDAGLTLIYDNAGLADAEFDDGLIQQGYETDVPTVDVSGDRSFLYGTANYDLSFDCSDTDSIIAGAEWFYTSTDPGVGNGYPMAASDGAFDELDETATTTLTTGAWGPGNHFLSGRAVDAWGNWSAAGDFAIHVNAPRVDASPSVIDFGQQTISAVASVYVELTNIGDADLHLTGCSFAGSGDFGQEGITPATIAPAGTFGFNVTYLATTEDVTTATLSVFSDAYGENTLDIPLSGYGAYPEIDVDPMSHDYGYGPLGTCSPFEFTIANYGPGALIITDVISSDPDVFEVAAATPIEVASGATTSLMVSFCPASPVDYEETVTLVSNDPGGDVIIDVQGTARFVDVSFDPEDAPDEVHDFGPVLVCNTVEWSFLMLNATTATADFDYTFAVDLPFEVLPTVGTLAPGSMATVTVTFHPTATGPTTGTLVLSSTNLDFGADIEFDLAGLGVAPDIDAVTDYQFPDTRMRAHSDYDLEISNIATSSTAVILNITNITSSNGDFLLLGVTQATIGTGETMTFPIRFAPSTVGTISGVIMVYSDDPDESAYHIDVWGMGLDSPDVGYPDLAARTDFGTLRVGEVTEGTLLITNEGTANLEISNIAITDNTESFSLDFATITTLAIATQWTITPGHQLEVDITFHPVEIGATTGTLTIVSNDPVNPTYEITLTGVAEAAPNIVVAPDSLDFGEVFVGDASQMTFEISNTSGLVDLIVTGVSSDTAEYVILSPTDFPITISTITPIEVTVEFTPSTIGTITGIVTVSNDDPETPSLGVGMFGIGYDDLVAPARIDNLTALTCYELDAGVVLSWTAPADDATDATTGPCASYDIRYSEAGPINDATDFAAATQLDTSGIVPATPGTIETHQFTMPEESVEYWFAITSMDDRANESEVSNSPSAVSLAVELVSFKASAGDGRVVLSWQTASEIDNLGFKLMRRTGDTGRFAQLNRRLIAGAGTTLDPQFYTYTDESVENYVTYYYYLVSVDMTGIESRSELVAATPSESDTVLSLDVSTNQPRFVSGDELLVSIGVANRGDTALIDARIWVTLPSGRDFRLLSVDGAYIDAGTAFFADLFDHRVSERDAVGEYFITCMITDNETGNIISYGVTSFRITHRSSIVVPEIWRIDGVNAEDDLRVRVAPDSGLIAR